MPKSLKPSLATTELGTSGTYIYNGQIESPDPNRDLAGERGLDIFDRMRRGDASVRAAYLARILPILSANWRVDPADDSEEAKLIAQEVDDDLHGMTRSFDEFLREALLYLVYGHYLFEIVYELRDDGRIGLRKLAPRLPRTVFAWETENGKDGITQLTSDGHKVSIPIEKLLVFINEREGDNWAGTSLLRSAYKPWHMKETLEKIDAIAHERQGVGIPKITPNPGVTAGKNDKDNAIEAAQNLRANADNYLYVPSGYDIEFMDMHANGRSKPLESAEYHRFEIFLSVLASFLTLGSTDSGSRALSTDLSDFFEMSIRYVANVGIAAPINQYLIPRLVDLNHTVKDYPKIACDGIGKVDFAAITESLARMSQFKTYTPQLEIENALRRAMGLPEAPEDTFYPDPSKEPQAPPVVNVEKTEEEPQNKQLSFLQHFTKAESKALYMAAKEMNGG